MDASASMAEALENDAFLSWFKTRGGSVHPGVGITTFPSMGRGAVALQDIKKDTILFTLPRSLTLSTRTSSLPSKLGEREWKRHQLHRGWVGLILCMLWEDAAGENGKWSCYLSSLPDRFQTPMFWDADDLQELQGTTIFDKIGKAEAEKDYHEKLLPAIKSRPDLFPTAIIESQYSLHRYHTMGSRILSRSFHVERWGGTNDESDDDRPLTEAANKNDDMDVDTIYQEASNEDQLQDVADSEESDDEDEKDPSDVAMVPLADVLNARYRSENAKLCYDSEDLQMICTRDIQTGEQIWNTYGDPPNSGLLRRYGHVDLITMVGGVQGNPADIVEIRADIVLEILRTQLEPEKGEALLERIEWWLEEGGDDVFALDTTFTLPEDLISLTRILAMPKDEWKKTQAKRKVPKPKPDANILRVVAIVLKKRLDDYKTTLEEDEALIEAATTEIGSNKYMAIVVRLGEKRILKGALEKVTRKLAGDSKDSKKRRMESEDINEAKLSKRSRR